MTKKTLFIAGLALALTLPGFASIGKTAQDFGQSSYATENKLTLDEKSTDASKGLFPFTGNGNKAVILKCRKDVVFYERLIWISPADKTDEQARLKAFASFLIQAINAAPGSTEEAIINQNVKDKISSFEVGKTIVVKLVSALPEKGKQRFTLEVYQK